MRPNMWMKSLNQKIYVNSAVYDQQFLLIRRAGIRRYLIIMFKDLVLSSG